MSEVPGQNHGQPRAEDAEIAEALAFIRARKCRCCGTWKSNCVCWANYGTDSNGKVSSASCTPASHGRDGYAW